jgi:hypothetical protein
MMLGLDGEKLVIQFATTCAAVTSRAKVPGVSPAVRLQCRTKIPCG